MFCVSGTGTYSNDLFPPLELGDNSDDWEIGLLSLSTYNSIPNVEEGVNNVFAYGQKRKITIPEGSYEIDDINNYIKSHLAKDEKISFYANNNTLKCEINTNQKIDFTAPDSIGRLLGFDPVVLAANKTHTSQHPVSIISVNSIRVDCNIARGSYNNGVEGHTLYEFYPAVAPGFKIVEAPPFVTYLPVNTNRISNITLQILDQEGRPINFRGEEVTVRLELRRRRKLGGGNGSGVFAQ